MKEHNYALEKANTRPRLQSRTQHICSDISISAVILKLMVGITSIFGSYRFLRIAWHDIFLLSRHLPAGRHLIPSTKLTSSSHKTFHFSYMKFLDEMFIKVKVSSIFKEKNNLG